MACDNPSVDIDSIQNQLDVNIRSLSEGWCGSIPFQCFVIDEDYVMNTIPTEIILSEINLFQYLNGNKYPALSDNVQATFHQ